MQNNSKLRIKHSKLIKDDEVIETTTKFEFNLGFAKVSRSTKKIKNNDN